MSEVRAVTFMQIKIGYDIGYGADLATPMVIMLNVHPSRHADVVGTEVITTNPQTPITFYRDGFGNVCGRLVLPAGGAVISCRAVVRDTGVAGCRRCRRRCSFRSTKLPTNASST